MAIDILRSATIRQEQPGKLILRDLRELVETTLDFDENLEVVVERYHGDLEDPGYSRITVEEK